ncbi:EAL domain-containing protein [Psychrobacter sp. F1192]|uniref:EAL domain-containing protein n=1 Tax=Psychrobacter coccoides TaxID=2818440 RepID=A0ABS3NMM7_9GAMM|nr:GGDEF domain-containing phosphodiesterase [Psychrobacter coccoides]MBO1530598.1 EAL domain-containing protein [Psychrobacter coccoides]
MHTKSLLNLLVIDDDQLYAERLVRLLSAYYDEVNLGFLDDKEELIKSLRHQWDVLVFGRAYDLSFTDVVGIIQEQGLDLPVIGLMSDEMAKTGRNGDGMPAVIDGTMVKALLAHKETQVIMAIRLQHANLRCRRQLQTLQHVISESELRADILIKNSKSAVAYIDQGIHIFANEPYLKLFNFESMEEVIGVPVIDLIANGDSVKEFKHFLRQFDKGSREQVEFNFESRRMDGSTFEAKLQLAAATLDGEPVTQIIIQQSGANSAEIAQRLAAAEREDSLTGLNNRRGFEERFEALCQSVSQQNATAGLLYIQLDNIGKISSSLGLQGVDTTIKKIADVLSDMLAHAHISRFSDTVFTVLIEKTITAEALKALAERIRQRIGETLIEVESRTTTTTASIGIVKIDSKASESQVLLERAVEAVSHIKVETSSRGDAIHMYDPSEHASSDDTALAEYLISAITNHYFEVLFQPIYDVNNDRSDFFEVYLRLPLNDADNTVLTPHQFMMVAKKHDLREKIDRWLLINACKQLNHVRKTYPETRLLIQLSSASLLDKKLVNVASQLIKAVGGAPGALTLQFREEDVVNHLTVAKSQFAALNSVNCQISINNFGTSVKSIKVAEFVQPDLARLGRDYVENIDKAENLDTLKSLIEKTNELNIDVLMPYIEEAATMSVAWSVGARYLQGYYFEEPSKTINVV